MNYGFYILPTYGDTVSLVLHKTVVNSKKKVIINANKYIYCMFLPNWLYGYLTVF